MAATCTITTVTDPISALTETGVTATGTCTALNTVTVTIEDSLGATVGPTAATVTGTGWSLAATNVSALADGLLVYKATATDGTASAFDAAAGTKTTVAADYITLAELRAYIRDPSTLDTGPAQNAISAASRMVDAICGRAFYQITGYRYLNADHMWDLDFGALDLATATGFTFATDADNSGSYATSWTIGTDFVLTPVNQLSDGIITFPYTGLRAMSESGLRFPIRYPGWGDTIKMYGTWGWPSVPAPVKQATFILAALYFSLGPVPLGAMVGEWGVARLRENPLVKPLLGPYSKSAGFGIA